jgi:hypothetical protein
MERIQEMQALRATAMERQVAQDARRRAAAEEEARRRAVEEQEEAAEEEARRLEEAARRKDMVRRRRPSKPKFTIDLFMARSAPPPPQLAWPGLAWPGQTRPDQIEPWAPRGTSHWPCTAHRPGQAKPARPVAPPTTSAR